MKANSFRAVVLAGLITLFAPAGQMVAAQAAAPAAAPVAQTVSAATGAAKTEKVDMAKVPEGLREQVAKKEAVRDRLREAKSMGAARMGEPVDRNQVSTRDLKLDGTQGGFAYIEKYTEPNDFAHRNYCGPGAATAVISHFDGGFARSVDIDQLGEEMNMDPNMGVWVRDITKPVNDHVNDITGQDLNWYQSGQAASKDEFRFMLDYGIRQNGTPLVTSLYTGGLPGWNGQDVGHIVAVYGYYQDEAGTEWVAYADTAPEQSGYAGPTFQAVEFDTFWEAVSGNSAQVW